MINSIQSDANPPDPNPPIPNCQRNAKDMITMINSIQSDPNLPDPNHPIPNRFMKRSSAMKLRVETGSVIPQTSIVAVSFDWIRWKRVATNQCR